MELNEKIHALRKQKGLTQEELAEVLFVSRTAISKWESGRGYPSIDSLRALARFFGVTIDDLLSGDELLTIAEADARQKEKHLFDLLYGLLDCSAAMLFFLPFFAHRGGAAIQAASLLTLGETAFYVRIAYVMVVMAMIASGIATLALQHGCGAFWAKRKRPISLVVNALGVLLMIISSQPYAATLLFVFLVIKASVLIKWP